VSLGQIAFDLEAILFISVARLLPLERSARLGQPTLLTAAVCWHFSLCSFSIPLWTIFRRSFIPPAKAASGSSSSVFICWAMCWCALAMLSTSRRMTSRDMRSDPDSPLPRGLRARLSSLRAYSSSMAARAAAVSPRTRLAGAPHWCKRPLVRRWRLWRCACGPGAGCIRRHLCPRNYSRLFVLVLADSDTVGPTREGDRGSLCRGRHCGGQEAQSLLAIERAACSW
jgi:hypothetical protein